MFFLIKHRNIFNRYIDRTLHIFKYTTQFMCGFSLPLDPLAAIVQKCAVLPGAQRLHRLPQLRHSVGHLQRCLVAAQSRPHPSRMHADAQQTVGGEFDAHRFGGSVQGGLGHAIGEHGAVGVAANRAQHRGHVDDDGTLNARLRGRLGGGGGFEERQEGLEGRMWWISCCVQ